MPKRGPDMPLYREHAAVRSSTLEQASRALRGAAGTVLRRHAICFTAFLYGWRLGADARLWAEFARRRRFALVLMLGTFAVYFALVETLPDALAWPVQALLWTLRNLYIGFALCAILGWAHARLSRPWPWLHWANEAVLPWYVLQQSLTVLIAHWAGPLRWPAALEAAAVLGGRVAGCWIGFAIIRRVGPLRPLFGLQPRAPCAPTPVALGTARV